MTGTASDALSNINSVHLFDNAAYEVKHLDHDVNRLVKSDRDLKWFIMRNNFIQYLGVTALITAMMLGLLYGINQGWVSAGDFALVLTLSISLVHSVNDVGKQMH